MFLIIVFVCYFLFVAFLILGWNRLAQKQSTFSITNGILVTVVIPARNEASNVGQLLSDLENQNYPAFEVIVVDDHSEDHTKKVVERFVEKNSRFRILTNSGVGKKTALTLGIGSANGSIIITTDADCRVSSEWISSLTGYFGDNEVKMVIGCVKMEANSLFSSIQALEFASLIGSGVAMASWKHPIMCNGANLAFRKQVFEEVEGYQGNFHIPSGDDEFLMRKVLEVYPGGLAVSLREQSVVTTLPNRNTKEFFQQRIRWAGKWSANTSIASRLSALFVFCVQLNTLLLPLFLATKWVDVKTSFVLLLIKICLELLFLKKISLDLGIRWSWLSFGILQLTYPAYVVIIGLLSRSNSFVWKGRKLNSLTFREKLNKGILG